MKWQPQSILKPEINIFQAYDISTGFLIHQISDFAFYQYLQTHAPGQCFQSSIIGCMKAYYIPADFRTAYNDFYN